MKFSNKFVSMLIAIVSSCSQAADHTKERVLQFECDDSDGPDADDCLYNQCTACLEPLWMETCVGDHYPAECCNSMSRHVWCLTDRSNICGTSLTDGLVAASLAETVEDFCGEGCPIDWEGCDNDFLCSCFGEYKTSSFDCKYNDDTCLCPLETAFVDCTQPEVDNCGNNELNAVHAQRIQRRDEICGRAGDEPTIPVPPAFCNDAGGPNSQACLYNECIACYQPLFYSTCSGDHFPAECCDVLTRYVSCLKDRTLTCGTSRTDGFLALSLTETVDAFCGEGCPINWEGCDNELLCSCFIEYKTSSRDCKYNDDSCRCPLETEFVDCTQPEVDSCDNDGLKKTHAQRIQQRNEICARANDMSPAPVTSTPTVPVSPSPTVETSTTATRSPATTAPTMPATPVSPATYTSEPTLFLTDLSSSSANQRPVAVTIVMCMANIMVDIV